MEHNLFKVKNFEEGKEAVVGHCNGYDRQQRWDAETSLFAKAIIRNIKFRDSGCADIIDYGCGVGRLAQEVIKQSPKVIVHGVDASQQMLNEATKYISNSGHFHPSSPTQINMGQGKADLVYCVYVLQHVPCLEIREILQRIYDNLKTDGAFVYCSSDYRMAINFNGSGFWDDRSTNGVNLQEEIERYFVKVGSLFTDQEFQQHEILRRMVKGEGGNNNLPHPAFVYKKKKLMGPLYDAVAEVVSSPIATPSKRDRKGRFTKEENQQIEEHSKEVFKREPIVAESFDRQYTKLILVNRLAPGDILVMTNALRDLHLAFPGKYETEVRTPCNSIFDNNPYCTHLSYSEDQYQEKERELHKGDKNGSTFVINDDILCIDMHYPMIHTSGEAGWHFGYGHRDFLETVLGVKIPQTKITPELYLSQAEKDWISPVVTMTGDDKPYWVINAGSKGDYTLKQYPYYQEVVDLLKDKVNFVQVGLAGHNHVPLNGALNMVGKTTDVRKLFRVIHGALGVLTCVSFPMHIAAAFNKPCVVVAGGREGPRWEMYPNHQYLYVNGCLPCATYDGCWKSRFEDCVNKVANTPRCMTMITPHDIARSIERYYDGGILTR